MPLREVYLWTVVPSSCYSKLWWIYGDKTAKFQFSSITGCTILFPCLLLCEEKLYIPQRCKEDIKSTIQGLVLALCQLSSCLQGIWSCVIIENSQQHKPAITYLPLSTGGREWAKECLAPTPPPPTLSGTHQTGVIVRWWTSSQSGEGRGYWHHHRGHEGQQAKPGNLWVDYSSDISLGAPLGLAADPYQN